MRLNRTAAVITAAGLAAIVGLTSLSAASGENGAAGPPPNGHFGKSGKDIAGDYWNPNAQYQPSPRQLIWNPWPKASAVVARLKYRGVNPILTPGYNDPVYERNAFLDGAGTSVNAVMMHDTGTSVPASQLRNTHSLDWIMYGVKSSQGKTVRACHLYVARNGDVYVVYTGRTWHAGAGDSMFGVPAYKMNGYSYGIEIESQGGGVRDLTPAQINSASRVAAALLEVAGLPLSRTINHKDYAGRIQGKVDTAYPIEFWKARIAAVISGKPVTPPPPPTNSKQVRVSAVKPGNNNSDVKRYQVSLRSWLAARKMPVKRINPSGATGYFGSETEQLTRVAYSWLRIQYAVWRSIPNPGAVPIPPLIKVIGLIPV